MLPMRNGRCPCSTLLAFAMNIWTVGQQDLLWPEEDGPSANSNTRDGHDSGEHTLWEFVNQRLWLDAQALYVYVPSLKSRLNC